MKNIIFTVLLFMTCICGKAQYLPVVELQYGISSQHLENIFGFEVGLKNPKSIFYPTISSTVYMAQFSLSGKNMFKNNIEYDDQLTHLNIAARLNYSFNNKILLFAGTGINLTGEAFAQKSWDKEIGFKLYGLTQESTSDNTSLYIGLRYLFSKSYIYKQDRMVDANKFILSVGVSGLIKRK